MSEFAKEEDKKVVNEEGEDDGGDDGPAPEEECAATFAPLVKLEAIEVKTLEEDEDVVYCQRARLFTFSEAMLDKGTGNKQWNERGVGDVKVLKYVDRLNISFCTAAPRLYRSAITLLLVTGVGRGYAPLV